MQINIIIIIEPISIIIIITDHTGLESITYEQNRMIQGDTSIEGEVPSIAMTTDREIMEAITITIIVLEGVKARRIATDKEHMNLLMTILLNDEKRTKNSRRINRHARIIVMTATI